MGIRIYNTPRLKYLEYRCKKCRNLLFSFYSEGHFKLNIKCKKCKTVNNLEIK